MEPNKKVKKLFFLPGWGGGVEDAAPLFSFLSSSFNCETLYEAPISALYPEASNINLLSEALEKKIKNEKSPFVLCGYSMGGRIAASLLSRVLSENPYANMLRGAIFLSAGMGFSTEKERILRREQEKEWTAILEKTPEKFWQRWYEQDLFQNYHKLGDPARRTWMKERNSLDNKYLAKDMERYGASSHTYLLPILKQIKKIPLLFIVGGLDAKYLALSHLVKSSISQASVLSIPEAGHILPLEAPDAVAREILAWQKNIKEA